MTRDLHAAAALVRHAQRDLQLALGIVADAGERAASEAVRHVLEQLVLATRRNEPLRAAAHALVEILGSAAYGTEVVRVLVELQLRARTPLQPTADDTASATRRRKGSGHD